MTRTRPRLKMPLGFDVYACFATVFGVLRTYVGSRGRAFTRNPGLKIKLSVGLAACHAQLRT